MALYDRSSVRSFFSEIAHEQDTCQYCENAIREKNNKKELSFDDMIKELRTLRGKLTGKRVMKFRYIGHEFCVCPKCLEKIHKEVQSFNTKDEQKQVTDTTPDENQADLINDEIQADSINDEIEAKRTKAKGKK